jgi:hypothetical protein
MTMEADDAAQMKAVSAKEARPQFQGRGFSTKVVEGILTNRIEIAAPESSLFMTPSEIAALREIQGIGKDGVSEIEAYRHRVLPGV